MGVPERFQYFACDADRVLDRQAAFARQQTTQRLTLDVRHDVEQQSAGLAGIEQRDDVGVAQRGRGLDLAQKALHAEARRELRMEQLDRDLALQLEIVSPVHRRHATTANLAGNRVVVCDGGLETSEESGQASIIEA